MFVSVARGGADREYAKVRCNPGQVFNGQRRPSRMAPPSATEDLSPRDNRNRVKPFESSTSLEAFGELLKHSGLLGWSVFQQKFSQLLGMIDHKCVTGIIVASCDRDVRTYRPTHPKHSRPFRLNGS
jgi:hypothetical protein